MELDADRAEWLLKVLGDFHRVERLISPPGVLIWPHSASSEPYQFQFTDRELLNLVQPYVEDELRVGRPQTKAWEHARSLLGQDFTDAIINASPNEGPWHIEGDEFLSLNTADQSERIQHLRRLGDTSAEARRHRD